MIRSEREEIGRGTIALCGFNRLGLITCDEPQEVTYPDGNVGMAWVGIHIEPDLAGQPWSSRAPRIADHVVKIKTAAMAFYD